MSSTTRQAGAADLRSLWFSFINVSLPKDTVKQRKMPRLRFVCKERPLNRERTDEYQAGSFGEKVTDSAGFAGFRL
jgi:hypothetical protein